MNHTIRLTIVTFIIIIFLPKEACPAQQDFTFEHFDVDNELLDPTVNCIPKD